MSFVIGAYCFEELKRSLVLLRDVETHSQGLPAGRHPDKPLSLTNLSTVSHEDRYIIFSIF